MKSVKTMLLGIALLVIAACGAPLFAQGVTLGAVLFFAGLVVGSVLVLRGYFKKE